MKKLLITALVLGFTLIAVSQSAWTERTYLKMILDTKLMQSLECSLGGGDGVPATHEKVYAHLGLCTCHVSDQQRDCSNENDNQIFCFSQITPYQSEVWQHVVGNWGEIADDDGVGLMTAHGDGVYSIEFIVEDYFSSSDVSTEQTVSSALPSQPWNPDGGGKPYTMGVVFRNEDGSSSGRDDLCNDLFIIDIIGDPIVVQSSDDDNPEFAAISIEVAPASVEQIMSLSHNTSIFPNPASDKFNIRYKLVAPSNDIVIEIFDVLGKNIKTISSKNTKQGWQDVNIDTADMNEGLYFIKMSINKFNAHTQRLVIKK
jgi:5-hydroxyisourate hydrolase-like protein (transthyretin family)